MSGGGGGGATSNGPVPAPPNTTGSTAQEERPWERAWTIDEMRKGAHDWSLASDAGVR